jgi:predicted ATPase
VLGREFSYPLLAAVAGLEDAELQAISDMLAGLALGAETGIQGGAPVFFAVLAAAYMIAGQVAEARGTVDTGLAIAAQTGEHYYDVELHRLQGEIVLHLGGAPTEAEAFFQQALEVARSQEAKSMELRTTIRLARLWRDQGKRAEARDLLAPH